MKRRRYAIGYGADYGYAVEIEYTGGSFWRFSVFKPLRPAFREILKTTTVVRLPESAPIARVYAAGMQSIDMFGGEEEVCNDVPPNITVCINRHNKEFES
jgi:hypothetical protein